MPKKVTKVPVKEEKKKSIDSLIDTKSKMPIINNKICASIRSADEPHLRCLMKTKNDDKYCPMHLIQKNIIDFVMNEFSGIVDDDILNRDEIVLQTEKKVSNNIIRKINLSETSAPKKILKKEPQKKSTKDDTMYEQKKVQSKIIIRIMKTN